MLLNLIDQDIAGGHASAVDNGEMSTAISPGSLFARAFYNVCHDVVRLADVLGHSSIETTRIYLLSTGKEYARQLDRLGLVQ